MPVEDVFTITGRGTVATGRVERGVFMYLMKLKSLVSTDETRKVVVTGIEMFRNFLTKLRLVTTSVLFFVVFRERNRERTGSC